MNESDITKGEPIGVVPLPGRTYIGTFLGFSDVSMADAVEKSFQSALRWMGEHPSRFVSLDTCCTALEGNGYYFTYTLVCVPLEIEKESV